jgi:translation elongation factor EF-4
MREALIHWCETRKILKRKEEEESDESNRIFKALMVWINGEEFEDAIRHIDDAKKAAQETRNQVVLMRNYINTQLEKVTKFQNSIDHNLICTRSIVGKLREFLNSGSPKIFT